MKTGKLSSLTIIGAVFICMLINMPVVAQQPSERELQLEKMVKQLMERVEELEAKVEKSAEERETIKETIQSKGIDPTADPNGVKSYWKGGLNFESNDGAHKMKIGGRVQNDWYAGSIENGEAPDGTRFRRIWLKTLGKFYDDFNYKIQYDLAGTGIGRWKDIWVDYTGLEYTNIKLGFFKEPFSMEELMLNRDLSFLERATLNAFVPSRGTGIMFHNTALDDRLLWQIGAFKNTNSFGDGDEGDADDGDWDVTARLTGLPWYEDGGEKLLHIGIAGSHREWGEDPLRYRARGSYSRGDRLIDTGAFNADAIDLIGAELGLVYGPFNLMSEYVLSNVDTQLAGSESYDSFYVQASYFITGESRPYSQKDGMWTKVKPNNNFSVKNGGWGAWEFALRYSTMDLSDTPNLAAIGGDMDDYTVGLNWYLNPSTRVMWNYVHSESDETTIGDQDADWFLMRLQYDF